MKKILILALVLMSAKLLAIELPKDTLWTRLGFQYDINNAIFSLDETKVYVNTTEGLAILDAKTGKDIEFIPNIDKAGSILAESIDGNTYINRNMEKYDSKTRQMIWKCPTRDSKDFAYLASTISQNGKYIVLFYAKPPFSTSQDETNTDIYDSETQEKLNSFNLKFPTTLTLDKHHIAISNNAKYLIVGADSSKPNSMYGSTAFLYDLTKNSFVKRLWTDPAGVSETSAMFSYKDNYAISKWDDYITVLNLNTMESFVYTPSGGGGYGSRIGKITPDEKYIVSGGVKNGWVELYDIQNKTVVYTAGTKRNGEAPIARVNKNNSILLLISSPYLFAFDLTKVWTDVPNENTQQITISPNPVNNRIRISNPNNTLINSISAYNVSGGTFLLQLQNNEINVTHLVKGSYYLKLVLADNSVLNFNFIKE